MDYKYSVYDESETIELAENIESEHFPNDPTDIAKFEADYNKLFINRIKDIKQLLKN